MKGFNDGRDLWPVWQRLIEECHPPTIFGEQVAGPGGRAWLARVRADLEALGYAVAAADLPAACVAAPHIRQRLFWVADAKGDWGSLPKNPRRMGTQSRRSSKGGGNALGTAHPDGQGLAEWELQSNNASPQSPPSKRGSFLGRLATFWAKFETVPWIDGSRKRIEPGTFPVVDGFPERVAQVRAYGDAIVPQVGALFARAVMLARKEASE